LDFRILVVMPSAAGLEWMAARRWKLPEDGKRTTFNCWWGTPTFSAGQEEYQEERDFCGPITPTVASCDTLAFGVAALSVRLANMSATVAAAY
jgi:hypothetical protein